ncbi:MULTISPECIES: NUDIX hydrolase [Bacillaceae]|uniref:NUDIX hydrolase n=1 Tax=Gottfriedia luciferensis TaxID=178774 RepID=A0ABX2ZXX8_9BACI|nr:MULTISPECIES: NUDIX hydrolase [Bacillaceae]ODG93505.1 NUDIX hydrolase [Gottfriedia luciferensis]PGZ93421.1 NUDIX domain-containing protein [Bacillus sp. AFS029533]SFC44263.1 ADP-ribose pyrophosphatase YjhB, NUDIX family [Bacillus sp. UNCCL81]
MDYIKNMRKYIGNETLFTIGCGIIIEENEQILLQHRTDEDNWCIPGGIMEIGETFEEAAKRETLEETGLTVTGLELFGIYSGEKCFVQYPNGDKAFSVQIIFLSKQFTGELKQKDIESREHRFFRKTELPTNLNPRQKSFIIDWEEDNRHPIIK